MQHQKHTSSGKIRNQEKYYFNRHKGRARQNAPNSLVRQKIRKSFYSNPWKGARIKIWTVRIRYHFRVRFRRFFKGRYLTTLYAIVCETDYAAHFQIFVNINGYNIRIIIDSSVTGNFILIKIIKIHGIFK